MQLKHHLLTIVVAVLIACVGAIAVAAMHGAHSTSAAGPGEEAAGCASVDAHARHTAADAGCGAPPPQERDGTSKKEADRKHSAATHEASEPRKTDGSPAARATSRGDTASESLRPNAVARRSAAPHNTPIAHVEGTPKGANAAVQQHNADAHDGNV